MTGVAARPLRLVVVNWTARVAGGAESYLRDVLPALAARGHTLGLWSERDVPSDRPSLSRSVAAAWCVERDGLAKALAGLRAWSADVLYLHGLERDDVEELLLPIGPCVGFVHTYRGTCISGEKAFKLPTRRPCQRTFGPACLALFFPRRCGGLNPVTMTLDYARQRSRLARLGTYRHLVTASEHMRRELLRHGVPRDRVTHLPLPPAPPPPAGAAEPAAPPGGKALPHRLLWVGRMEHLKGGDLALDAVRIAAERLDRPLGLTLVGDGRARTAWEKRARRITRGTTPLSIEFTGWVDESTLDDIFARSDLLVMSSVWPEPFGRAGVEAGRSGVPAAAFAVGGIPEWLVEGVSGHLASGEPPSIIGLADALVRCLHDPAHHAELRAGARRLAARVTMAAHVERLERLLTEVAVGG